MRQAYSSAARRDLEEWSEPFLTDQVMKCYKAYIGGDRLRVLPIMLQHCRLWRNLLRQEGELAQNARRELVRLGRLAGLDIQMLDRIDEAVLDELAEVVAERFHRSPDKVRECTRLLMRAASRLTQTRLAA